VYRLIFNISKTIKNNNEEWRYSLCIWENTPHALKTFESINPVVKQHNRMGADVKELCTLRFKKCICLVGDLWSLWTGEILREIEEAFDS
jgi:hypothetical protein